MLYLCLFINFFIPNRRLIIGTGFVNKFHMLVTIFMPPLLYIYVTKKAKI